MNHENLTSNVSFEDLPEWFQKSKTKNACVLYENELLTWKNGTWIDGTWKYGFWEGGYWEGGTWEDGYWEGGIWKYGFWIDGIWKYGFWETGIWEGGYWEEGIWKGGIWKNGTWENGYKLIGFCKWDVYYNSTKKTVKIGCIEKTIEEWDEWFLTDKIYETKRDTEQFKLIYKSYLLAKTAII